jgi:hypothetical protein
VQRINSIGATADNRFTKGDPTRGIPATVVSADWLNSVQEELANIVEMNGGSLNTDKDSQIAEIIQLLITESKKYTFKVSQAGHCFNVGDVLKKSNTVYAKAKADILDNAKVIGIVKDIIDKDNFNMITFGLLAGNYTNGSVYYLDSANEGKLTTIKPNPLNQIIVYMGIGINDGLLLNIDSGIENVDLKTSQKINEHEAKVDPHPQYNAVRSDNYKLNDSNTSASTKATTQLWNDSEENRAKISVEYKEADVKISNDLTNHINNANPHLNLPVEALKTAEKDKTKVLQPDGTGKLKFNVLPPITRSDNYKLGNSNTSASTKATLDFYNYIISLLPKFFPQTISEPMWSTNDLSVPPPKTLPANGANNISKTAYPELWEHVSDAKKKGYTLPTQAQWQDGKLYGKFYDVDSRYFGVPMMTNSVARTSGADAPFGTYQDDTFRGHYHATFGNVATNGKYPECSRGTENIMLAGGDYAGANDRKGQGSSAPLLPDATNLDDWTDDNETRSKSVVLNAFIYYI